MAHICDSARGFRLNKRTLARPLFDLDADDFRKSLADNLAKIIAARLVRRLRKAFLLPVGCHLWCLSSLVLVPVAQLVARPVQARAADADLSPRSRRRPLVECFLRPTRGLPVVERAVPRLPSRN